LKNPKFLLTVFLLAMAAATPVPHAYSSTLTVTVFTDKPSYLIAESITVSGNLTYNGSPVPNWSVALEVQDPTGTPVVTRTPQTDTNGTYNLTFKLPTDAELGTYTVYVSSGYKGETATDNSTFTLGNVYETTITIEGKDYTMTAESNATIANAAATRTTLDFTISGLTGQTAYVNTTLPMGLNKTEIKVFIDNNELVPPPFPTIASNGTHYLVYFEFTLSTHNITIRYARADIATTNITSAKTVLGQGFTTSINATVQNQGDREETFNVTLCANTTSLASQNVTLSSGNYTTITFTWNATGFARGNYTISAHASQVQGETDMTDNNCTGGWVVVAGVGDLTGGTPNPYDFVPDGKVLIEDVSVVAKCFGQKVPPAPANVDLTGPTIGVPDGKVQIDDVATVAKHFGQHYP